MCYNFYYMALIGLYIYVLIIALVVITYSLKDQTNSRTDEHN